MLLQLALKHRQNKNQKMRIISFIGSPVEVETKEVCMYVGVCVLCVPTCMLAYIHVCMLCDECVWYVCEMYVRMMCDVYGVH